MNARLIALLGTVLLSLLPATVYAEYPEKPIRIIVPFEPGGANDIMARVTGPNLSKAVGQPVIVENRPGAGGNIGSVLVARSPADGYMLLFTAGGATLSRTVPIDAAIATAIAANPAGFYVNFHSTVNAGGVIRGQLTKG